MCVILGRRGIRVTIVTTISIKIVNLLDVFGHDNGVRYTPLLSSFGLIELRV